MFLGDREKNRFVRGHNKKCKGVKKETGYRFLWNLHFSVGTQFYLLLTLCCQ